MLLVRLPHSPFIAILLLVFEVFGLTFACVASEEVRTRVGPNRLVSAARNKIAHYEVVIACDPNDAKRFIIASMASASLTDHNAHEVVAFASTDGGVQWEVTQVLRGQKENASYYDPHLAYGADSTVYLVAILNNNSIKAHVSATKFLRSTDGGSTWPTHATLQFADRPFLLANLVDPTSKTLFCFAADDMPMATVSRDGGKSFTDWSPMVKKGTPYGMGNPAMLSTGELIVPYPVRRGSGRPCPVTLTVARSADGGRSYLTSTVADYTHDDNGVPSLAIDASYEANKDDLYLVWPDGKGKLKRVYFSRSTDGGKKWTQPILLSEQTDEGESPMPHQAYLPNVAVNKAGVVGVSWYDTRGLPENANGWNIRFRCSLDGGETWQPSRRVTDQDSILLKGGHWSASWAGDTAGLAADADGAFRAAWIDNCSGVRQVWTSRIRVD